MISALTLLAASLAAQPSEEEAVLDVIDAFFVAVERADAQTLGAMTSEDFSITAIAMRDGDPVSRLIPREAWLGGLDGKEGMIVEPYWDAKVQVSPVGLAHVWAPYHVQANGKPIHCGIDAFTLVKTGGAWTITDLHYTADPEGCDRLGYDEAEGRMRPDAILGKLNRAD